MRWWKDKESINQHKSIYLGWFVPRLRSLSSCPSLCMSHHQQTTWGLKGCCNCPPSRPHWEVEALCYVVCGTTLQTVMRRKGTNPMPLQHPDDPVLCMCCSHATGCRGRWYCGTEEPPNTYNRSLPHLKGYYFTGLWNLSLLLKVLSTHK